MFRGPREIKKLVTWLKGFQDEVNVITSSDDMIFTMVIWKSGEIWRELEGGKIEICEDSQLPYLDTEMCWNEDQALCFECHSKPNFQYKYLNKDSFHTSNCKRAVTCGVKIQHGKHTH